MEREIKQRLAEIEAESDVVIPLAVESGSRAWGFPSTDSDYDVRFLYVRRPEWYLSIDLEHKRDVIEPPIDAVFDFSGWDVRKALWLFKKSNPPLLEWLQCPLVYRERFSLAQKLRGLLPTFYSPRACYYHYLHMARGNYREYLRGDEVWRKKYFYLLRPLLAIRWIETRATPVPIEFDRLVEATVESEALATAIETLVKEKKEGLEMGRGPRIPVISDYIENELARLEETPSGVQKVDPPIETLNTLFRDTLAEVWEGGPPG